MLLLLLIVVLFLVFGGGYYGYNNYPAHRGGIGIVGLILVVLISLWLFGGGFGLGAHHLFNYR